MNRREWIQTAISGALATLAACFLPACHRVSPPPVMVFGVHRFGTGVFGERRYDESDDEFIQRLVDQVESQPTPYPSPLIKWNGEDQK